MAAPCGCDKGVGEWEEYGGSQQNEFFTGEIEVEQMLGSF